MLATAFITTLALLGVASAQQVGTNQAETHPSLPIQHCTGTGSCTSVATKIVLDANWRWLHTTSGYTNCYTGNTWDATLCPDDKTCAANCALEGADYSGTYGITTSGNALTLKFVTGKNIGSRVYLLNTDTAYQMFKLKNQEFTFDVDMSNLGCGLNGALYMTAMDADGGMGKYSTNKAGAKYGTGYCDAQCPHDIKFINGEANVEGWKGSDNDANAGKGKYGSCCTEMDIWEANYSAAAYTPHPCSTNGQYRCSGTECGDGDQRYSSVCDKDGCDFNSWRMGNRDFLGQGKTIDTNKKFTVVTQFITSTGTASGTLSEIRRIYVQNGVVYQNSQANFSGLTGNSITDSFCTAQKTLFGDQNQYKAKGGLAKVGDAYTNGMVLALSIWDDHEANMLWLDSNYPVAGDASKPGISRGPCATSSGVPKDVEANQANSSVIFSNIKYGDIGSTYSGTAGGSTTRGGTTTTTRGGTTTTTASGATQSLYGQCGGTGWTGPTQCQAPATCKAVAPPYYSQCQP